MIIYLAWYVQYIVSSMYLLIFAELRSVSLSAVNPPISVG